MQADDGTASELQQQLIDAGPTGVALEMELNVAKCLLACTWDPLAHCVEHKRDHLANWLFHASGLCSANVFQHRANSNFLSCCAHLFSTRLSECCSSLKSL